MSELGERVKRNYLGCIGDSQSYQRHRKLLNTEGWCTACGARRATISFHLYGDDIEIWKLPPYGVVAVEIHGRLYFNEDKVRQILVSEGNALVRRYIALSICNATGKDLYVKTMDDTLFLRGDRKRIRAEINDWTVLPSTGQAIGVVLEKNLTVGIDEKGDEKHG